MKKLTAIFIVAALAMAGCNNKEPNSEGSDVTQHVDPVQEFAKLNEFLKKFDEPSQIFQSSTDKLIRVKGKNGTIIHLDPANLETESGQPIGKEITIELKELSNQQQLLRANAQTVSDGQLLVSGGAYYINVTSGGEKLKLKEGKTYAVEFPKISDDEMALFYGVRDSSGSMNWKKTEQNFKVPMPTQDSVKEYNAVIITGTGRFADTSSVAMKNVSKEEYAKIVKEAKLSDKIYSPAELKQFG